MLGAARLATTIRNQQQQPDRHPGTASRCFSADTVRAEADPGAEPRALAPSGGDSGCRPHAVRKGHIVRIGPGAKRKLAAGPPGMQVLTIGGVPDTGSFVPNWRPRSEKVHDEDDLPRTRADAGPAAGALHRDYAFTRSPDAADVSMAAMTSWRRTASAKSGTV